MADRESTIVSEDEIARQESYMHSVRELDPGTDKKYLIHTFGCQMNENDSEKLAGMLESMGYRRTYEPEESDLVLFNTCCVRENAELKVYGHLGTLKHLKARRPGLVIAVCGCMMQQVEVVQHILEKYRHVDLIFGTHNLHRFPELLFRAVTGGSPVTDITSGGYIAEGLPIRREHGVKAWLTIMYGCNNFCSYCIVPYVRGRERSRRPEDVLAEVKALADEGYRDITLLGQNVNSYGKDLGLDIDFADLLERIDAIPGDFLIRFMTSHPKDASQKLFETMARCKKVAPAFHLPFQAGSDRVLKAMNRVYDRAGYLDKVRRLREQVPDVVITSDVIVGFPGETTPEFEETLSLIEEVRFDALFTFIYSPREGTPAASMPDPMSRAEKQANFQRLVDVQNVISAEKHAAYVGRTLRCLIDGVSEDAGSALTARTPGNRLVRVADGDASLVGQFRDVEITAANTWSLFGKLAGRG